PWNAGHVALDFGIQRHPVLEIFLLFGGRRGKIRNLAALHDSRPAWNRADRAELKERSGLSAMVANVPVCRTQSLPKTSQVRFPVRHPRRLRSCSRWSLADARNNQ